MQALLSLFTTLALAGAETSALDRVGPLREIYESYNDCFAATEGGQLRPDALIKRGWARAKSEGKDTDSPMIFGRGDRAPVVMLSGDKNGGICIVMARFENTASLGKFLEAWGGKLPEFKNGELSFFAEGQPIIFRQAGSKEKPRLNLVVGTVSGSKQ